ncbi:hypothetical protein YWIDRAFT_02380 [Streptomyces sp. SceaMP-e96]|nr:hypothetical protein YWIDRAFT_02380 [Streptomyces sp. SceaMP-e96]
MQGLGGRGDGAPLMEDTQGLQPGIDHAGERS